MYYEPLDAQVFVGNITEQMCQIKKECGGDVGVPPFPIQGTKKNPVFHVNV